MTDWREFCKNHLCEKGTLPPDIPASPDKTYADKGWKGYRDWLGTERVSRRRKEYRPFAETRPFVRDLEIKNCNEWRAFCKGEMPRLGRLPVDIPTAPDQQYADNGWMGWGDWLGTGTVSNARRQFRRFHEARAFARTLNLKSGREWRAFYKGEMPKLGQLPVDIPAAPNRTYAKKGWNGMGDWLGTGRTRGVGVNASRQQC